MELASLPEPQPECSGFVYSEAMDQTVGVYVHIPFCEGVCPYCDFAVEPAPESAGRTSTGSAWSATEAEYVEDLVRELSLRSRDFSGRRLVSLYFGGGTPSLFQPESLLKIREAVQSAFPAKSPKVEITLEVNPSTVERSRLRAFREDVGVNRLSIGVQSFDDSLLKALGRGHLAEESRLTLEVARQAGFENISIDLMFAVFHQTQEMLAADLDQALVHAPEHISSYELVIEPRTPFGRAAEEGRMTQYPADDAADRLDEIVRRLHSSGYRRYELTNYARPGFEAVHNQRYWRREPVLGLGVGAHSLDPPSAAAPHGRRPANPRTRSVWCQQVRGGQGAIDGAQALSKNQAISEACFLSLRTLHGLNASEFASEFGFLPRHYFGGAIDRLTRDGLIDEKDDGRLALSEKGRLLADTVAAEFVLADD